MEANELRVGNLVLIDNEKYDLKNYVQNFEIKYADILIEWITLIKQNCEDFCWRPDNRNDEHGMMLYKKHCESSNKLVAFVKKTDINILCTYLKYHNSNRERVTHPWGFSYHEPDIDLVLCV